MVICAIDLSITSPGVAISGIGKQTILLSYSEHIKKNIVKSSQKYRIVLIPNTTKHKHTKTEYFKRIKQNAEMLVAFINEYLKDVKEVLRITFYIEGYSYSARGMVFDIAEMGGIVKYLIEEKYNTTIRVVEPSIIKKFATGKGNATKDVLANKIMEEEELKQMYQEIADEIKGKSKKNFTCTSPINDLTDALFLLKYAQQNHK